MSKTTRTMRARSNYLINCADGEDGVDEDDEENEAADEDEEDVINSRLRKTTRDEVIN